MTGAQEAHLRLLEQLRDKITTHECEPKVRQKGMKYTHEEKVGLRSKLIACFSAGMNRKQAAKECGCTNKTIVRLFGATYTPKRRRTCK